MSASRVAPSKHLLIETTTRCNLRCRQCAHVIKKYDFADMEMDIFHRLVPLFPHVEQVALYGHGETFLHKQFFAMLEELKKHDIFVYVTTNGTLITPDIAERLVDLRLDRLSFSLDAGTPELFNDIRLGADFDAVLDNIRLINSIKKRHHRDDQPVLSIMFCAMKSTIQELSKLIHLADQLNMTDGVAVINISEHDEQMQGECLARYPDLATRYLNEANRLATRLAIPLGGIHSGFGNLEIAPV
jgi:MoaA/NifB/PqqE/SkfB family radical SAM enzyme